MPEKPFNPDEKWELFARAFVQNKGNYSAAAEIAGFSYGKVLYWKKRQSFLDWLRGVCDAELFDAVAVAKLDLASAVADRNPLDNDRRQDIKLLFAQQGMIDKATVIDASTHNHGEVIPESVRNELIALKIKEQQMLEELARKN